MKLPGQAISMSRHHDTVRAARTKQSGGAGIGMSGIPCPVCDIGYQICKNQGGGIACDIAYAACKANCN